MRLALVTPALLAACAGPAALPPQAADTPPPVASSAPSAEPAPPALPREIRAGVVPTGFALDGSIAEWAAVSPVASGDGVRLWMAGSDTGLVFAGEMPEAKGAPPASLSVTVTSPRPELPGLGYMQDWSLMSLAQEEDCEHVSGDSDVPEDERARAQCRAWRVEQLERRARIEQRFTRKITVPLRANGRSFEGLLPVAELPLVADHLLRSFELALELPSAWHTKVSLDRPLRLVPEGSLAEHLFKEPLQQKESSLPVCDPAHPERIVYFFNEAGGFAVRPTTPSPDEMVVDLSKRRRVVELPGGTLVDEVDNVVPPVFRRAEAILVSSVGGRVVEVQALGRNRVSGVLRRQPDTADLVITYVGYYNTFGNGTCGACPVALLNVQTVHAGGHFDEPWWHEEIGGGPPMEIEPTSATASADGRTIEVEAITHREFEDKKGQTHSEETGTVEMTWTWNEAKGDFVKKERKLPKLKKRR